MDAAPPDVQGRAASKTHRCSIDPHSVVSSASRLSTYGGSVYILQQQRLRSCRRRDLTTKRSQRKKHIDIYVKSKFGRPDLQLPNWPPLHKSPPPRLPVHLGETQPGGRVRMPRRSADLRDKNGDFRPSVKKNKLCCCSSTQTHE